MAFQASITKTSLTGPAPVPNGIYELRFVKFRPKIAKSGNSLNYNLEAEVVNNPEYDGRKIFHPLNTAFGIAMWDFIHAFGLEMDTVMETIPNETTGQPEDVESFALPGLFEGAAAHPNNPEEWGEYKGPLTNATFKADVVETSYQGKPKNEIRAFICALEGCAEKYPDTRHSTNLIKKG